MLYPWYSVLYPWYSVLYPWYSVLYPWYSVLYPWYSVLYPWHSMLYPWYSVLYPWYCALLPATLAASRAINPLVAGATLDSMAAATSHYFGVEASTEVASKAHYITPLSLTSQAHFTSITQATTIPLQHASPLEPVDAPDSLVHSSAKPAEPVMISKLPKISAENDVYDYACISHAHISISVYVCLTPALCAVLHHSSTHACFYLLFKRQ